MPKQLEDKSDKRDPYRFAGKMGIRKGPVPIQQWKRDGHHAEGGSELGNVMGPAKSNASKSD